MREGFGAPKQSLESGTQKVCPHFFRPLFLSRSRVPKMGPQNRPLAQPWCAKCPRLTDSHLVACPCAATIAAATGQPIYWRTFRPILAEALSRSNWWKPATAFVLSQRSLEVLHLHACEKGYRERKQMKQPGTHICVISSCAAWLPYETKWCCAAFHVGPCLQERWLQTKYSPMLPIAG